jgi:hypothetical protein
MSTIQKFYPQMDDLEYLFILFTVAPYRWLFFPLIVVLDLLPRPYEW